MEESLVASLRLDLANFFSRFPSASSAPFAASSATKTLAPITMNFDYNNSSSSIASVGVYSGQQLEDPVFEGMVRDFLRFDGAVGALQEGVEKYLEGVQQLCGGMEALSEVVVLQLTKRSDVCIVRDACLYRAAVHCVSRRDAPHAAVAKLLRDIKFNVVDPLRAHRAHNSKLKQSIRHRNHALAHWLLMRKRVDALQGKFAQLQKQQQQHQQQQEAKQSQQSQQPSSSERTSAVSESETSSSESKGVRRATSRDAAGTATAAAAERRGRERRASSESRVRDSVAEQSGAVLKTATEEDGSSPVLNSPTSRGTRERDGGCDDEERQTLLVRSSSPKNESSSGKNNSSPERKKGARQQSCSTLCVVNSPQSNDVSVVRGGGGATRSISPITAFPGQQQQSSCGSNNSGSSASLLWGAAFVGNAAAAAAAARASVERDLHAATSAAEAARLKFKEVDDLLFEWLQMLAEYKCDILDSVLQTLKYLQYEFFAASAHALARVLPPRMEFRPMVEMTPHVLQPQVELELSERAAAEKKEEEEEREKEKESGSAFAEKKEEAGVMSSRSCAVSSTSSVSTSTTMITTTNSTNTTSPPASSSSASSGGCCGVVAKPCTGRTSSSQLPSATERLLQKWEREAQIVVAPASDEESCDGVVYVPQQLQESSGAAAAESLPRMQELPQSQAGKERGAEDGAIDGRRGEEEKKGVLLLNLEEEPFFEERNEGSSCESSSECTVDILSLAVLTARGFDESFSRVALQRHDNDTQTAMDWLLHGGVEELQEQRRQQRRRHQESPILPSAPVAASSSATALLPPSPQAPAPQAPLAPDVQQQQLSPQKQAVDYVRLPTTLKWVEKLRAAKRKERQTWQQRKRAERGGVGADDDINESGRRRGSGGVAGSSPVNVSATTDGRGESVGGVVVVEVSEEVKQATGAAVESGAAEGVLEPVFADQLSKGNLSLQEEEEERRQRTGRTKARSRSSRKSSSGSSSSSSNSCCSSRKRSCSQKAVPTAPATVDTSTSLLASLDQKQHLEEKAETVEERVVAGNADKLLVDDLLGGPLPTAAAEAAPNLLSPDDFLTKPPDVAEDLLLFSFPEECLGQSACSRESRSSRSQRSSSNEKRSEQARSGSSGSRSSREEAKEHCEEVKRSENSRSTSNRKRHKKVTRRRRTQREEALKKKDLLGEEGEVDAAAVTAPTGRGRSGGGREKVGTASYFESQQEIKNDSVTQQTVTPPLHHSRSRHIRGRKKREDNCSSGSSSGSELKTTAETALLYCELLDLQHSPRSSSNNTAHTTFTTVGVRETQHKAEGEAAAMAAAAANLSPLPDLLGGFDPADCHWGDSATQHQEQLQQPRLLSSLEHENGLASLVESPKDAAASAPPPLEPQQQEQHIQENNSLS